MREAVVVGKPNVGKTLFILNFADFLGQTSLAWEYLDSTGTAWRRGSTIRQARAQLVSPEPHHTLQLQRIHIEVPIRKGRRTLILLDTAGVAEGIPADPAVRAAMAHTLAQLGSGQLILHMVDASAPTDAVRGVGPVDDEIAAWAAQIGPYALLANKIDLPEARENLGWIQARFPRLPVIACSALTGAGFPEVKRFVFRHWLR